MAIPTQNNNKIEAEKNELDEMHKLLDNPPPVPLKGELRSNFKTIYDNSNTNKRKMRN